MATEYSPIAYIWPKIVKFATGDFITREFLRDSTNRAADIGYGVLAALNERWQQLGSTNAGTSAVQRGTVVMGTLSFYDPVDVPVGSLDGLTLILETDLAGPVTVTFAQPTSPVHVATQINTQAASLGIVASCDTGVDPNTGAIVATNVGKLLLARPSGGTASLKIYGAGTANALLGLPLIDTTTAGTGTANDGTSRIGFGATGSWPGGTLRAFLTSIANAILTSGGTLVGPLIVGSGGRIQYQDVEDLPDADTTLTLAVTFYRIAGGHAAPRTYTLPDVAQVGRVVYISKTNGFIGANNVTSIERADSTQIGQFDSSIGPGDGRGFMMFVSEDVSGTVKWRAFAFGGDAEGDEV